MRATVAALIVAAGLLGSALKAWAETLRVVSWNLQPKTVVTTNLQANNEPAVIEAAAVALKKLQPDVLLLQGVKDWQMCTELGQALKPADYNVAICSSFRRSTLTETNPLELAILTRYKAYFSWSEPWHSPEGMKVPGGFVFATLQIGERRIGVFSTEVGEPQLPALTAQQILDQIDGVKHWEANQPQLFVIGCTFDSRSKPVAPVQNKLLHFLQTGGLEDAFAEVRRKSAFEQFGGPRKSSADFVLIDTGGFIAHPAVVPVSVSDHQLLSCEVEMDPARVATARAAQAELVRGGELPAVSQPETNSQSAPAPARAPLGRKLRSAQVALWAGVCLAALLVIILVKRSRAGQMPTRKKPELLPERVDAGVRSASPAYTVLIAPHSMTASLADPNAGTPPQPVIQIEAPPTTQTQSAFWQQRALAAEEQAKRTKELLQQGLVAQLSQWLKQKLVRKLLVDRAQLIEAQQDAARKALKVDERLNRIEQQIREQNQAYERRIEELNRQLLAAKEESRVLIRARIAQVKAEMETARARLLAKAQEEL